MIVCYRVISKVEACCLRGREGLFFAHVELRWTREALLTAPVGWEGGAAR
jgi:hypothetical protein